MEKWHKEDRKTYMSKRKIDFNKKSRRKDQLVAGWIINQRAHCSKKNCTGKTIKRRMGPDALELRVLNRYDCVCKSEINPTFPMRS